jgi:hypothetical protein
MALLIQAECDMCRFVPDNPAVPHDKGKVNGGSIRDQVKAMGWQVSFRRKDSRWRFYCPECQAEQGKETAR